MNEINIQQTTVVRTSRGLSIAGTRITLYQIMDYLKANYPPEVIRDRFRLTIKQMLEVLKYIETHRDEVELEYKQILEKAEANRQYWEGRNRERLAKIATIPPTPEQAEIWSKLQAWKTQLAQEQ